MPSKMDTELAFVQHALNLRARRQEVLASNLANADTPNYKARDLDFASALKSAMGTGAGSLPLARTASGHLAGGAQSGGLPAGSIKYRAAVQPSLDGNTVDSDVERAHFTENTLHYRFMLERASGFFRTASLALSPAK